MHRSGSEWRRLYTSGDYAEEECGNILLLLPRWIADLAAVTGGSKGMAAEIPPSYDSMSKALRYLYSTT